MFNQLLFPRKINARSRRRLARTRRGISTLWLILILPALLILLCLVIEIGNLWLARVELEDSLEAAALSAVKEWGDANGGDTFNAREVAREFAEVNRVRGAAVGLAAALNYTAASTNDNTSSGGELVFGAITSTSPTVDFNANTVPSCGLGTVLFDASSGPNMQQINAWGINFSPVTTATNLTIDSVTIDLQETDTDAFFDFSLNPPELSDNLSNKVMYQDIAGSQADVSGLTGAAVTRPVTPVVSGTQTTWTYGQVSFVHDSTTPHLLTIRFLASGSDTGFNPGDRIRFGAQIDSLGANDDGDAVGASPVSVTTTFALSGTTQPPIAVNFADSNFRHILANYPAHLSPVSTNATYLLPQAPAAENNNDNQSYVELTGGGTAGTAFGVRARATVDVTSICSSIFGANFGPYSVSADTTAMYDCTNQCPQIIRVDNFAP
jgi:Flp pilus assembly protein TadG